MPGNSASFVTPSKVGKVTSFPIGDQVGSRIESPGACSYLAENSIPPRQVPSSKKSTDKLF